MTIQDVFDRLRPIEKAAAQLIKDTGFDPDDGMGERVRHLPDECEDAFLREKAESILDALSDIGSDIRYLRKPSHGEHTLRRLPNGRYGYTGKNHAVHVFTCGDRVEAKVRDWYGCRRWIVSSIEHDGSDYFLAGSYGTPLDGLTIRERW